MAWFGFLTRRNKQKKGNTNMSVIVSWAHELVDGAEAELKTVLSELETVYKDKLAEFKVEAQNAASGSASGPSSPPVVGETTTGATTPAGDATGETTAPASETTAPVDVNADVPPHAGNVASVGSDGGTTLTTGAVTTGAEAVVSDVAKGETLVEDVVTELKKMEPEVVTGVKTVLSKIMEAL